MAPLIIKNVIKKDPSIVSNVNFKKAMKYVENKCRGEK